MMTMFFVALVTTILLTPGPTNTLLAASGAQIGVRYSLRLIPAEAMGYCIAISAWSLLIERVSTQIPMVPFVLKLFSAAFMLYLAIKLWRTAKLPINLEMPVIRALDLFCATLLNPKALLFASAVFPTGAWQNITVFTVHLFVFVMLIIPIALFWIFIGSILASNRISWLNQANLQRCAAVVMLAFCLPLSYTAIRYF